MKKKWTYYSCFTVILFLLVACNKKQSPSPTKQSSIDKQIQVIADQVSVWKGEEEDLIYGYAVTDLDHNGRLELIASTCQGSGIYTYSSFFEVNENEDGLDECVYPGQEDGSEADIMKDFVRVYFDTDSYTYYYIFDDVIRYGAGLLNNNIRAISLQSGKISEKFICSSDFAYTEDDSVDDNMVAKYYDAEGNLISEEEYDLLTSKVFEDFEEKQATIQWENCGGEELLSMKEADLYNMLEKSYLGFSVK